MKTTRLALISAPARRHAALVLGLTLLSFTLPACSGCGGEGDGAENRQPTLTIDKQEASLTYTIGETIVLTVFAQDPDDDALTLEYEAKVDNALSTLSTAMWFPSPQMATFRWTPDSADVTARAPIELIFKARDDRGGYVDRKVTLTILPGNGMPRFEGSANELYKNCCEKPLGVDVRVRDDDSERVELTMTQGPQGADFSATGKEGSITSGRFTWKPNAEQSAQRVHNAVFVADDGMNPAVERRLTIIIPPDEDFGIDVRRNDSLEGICAGAELIEYVTHAPGRVNLDPSDDPLTANRDVVLVSAKLSELGEQSYDELFLTWEPADPLTRLEEIGSPCRDDPDSAACAEQKKNEAQAFNIQSTTDEATGVTTWTIDYELYFSLDQKSSFYRVCAFDKDREADDPAQIVCSPGGKPMYYSFRTYRDDQSACIDDGRELFGQGNDTFESATLASVDVWDRGVLCADNPDFFRVEVKPGAKLKPSVVFSPNQPVEVKLYDGDRKEISSRLVRPKCGGLVNVELEQPASASSPAVYYLQITGDESTYHVQSVALKKAAEDVCVDDALEPNDTASQATPFSLSQPATRYALCTGEDVDVYAFDLSAGDAVTWTMRYDEASQNIGDMTIFSPSQADNVIKGSTGSGFTFAFDTTVESLEYTARQCGRHHLLVFSADGTSSGEYSLEASVGKAACQDSDEFAESCNHTLGDARLFALDQPYQLELCGQSEDWLKRSGSGGVAILGEVEVTQGDVSAVVFEIYDSRGDLVTSAEPDDTSRLLLDYTFPTDEFYYFRIASSSEAPIAYTFFVTQ